MTDSDEIRAIAKQEVHAAPRNGNGNKWAIGALSTLLCATVVAGVTAAWGKTTTNAEVISKHLLLDAHAPMKVRADAFEKSLAQIDKRLEKLNDKMDAVLQRLP